MAIQAGRVGVDPSQVTLSGKIKGGGVSPEVLTKEEAARIYQTILGMAEYLKKTDANSLYQKISDMVDYQLKLVSGQNIKRINGEDLLGSGNISVLTTQLADGIYQKISGMADYVLKSELPDLTDLLTKTEAPGYNDILTRTSGLSLINNKLSIDGSSICYKTGAYNFNNFISGVAYGTNTCVSMPTSDTDYFIISSGDTNTRMQIAISITTVPTIYARKMTTVSNIATWTEWFALPNITDLNRKQNVLTPTNGIKINNNIISADTDVLQSKLIAGEGIKIVNNNISNVFYGLSGVDLNTIRYNYSGFVFNASANTPSGVNTNGQLVVIVNTQASGGTTHTTQFYRPYISNDLYMRFYNSNNSYWSNWREIGECYQAGDTFVNFASTAYLMCAGYLGNSTFIRFTIPVTKPIVANNVTFSLLTINVRGTSGMIVNNVDVISATGYSVETAISNSGIAVYLTIPSTTTTANTPVNVLIGNVRATFS